MSDDVESLKGQLTEAHQMASIGRLLAGIVHEINTPIGSIFSNNEVTRRSLEKVTELLRDPTDANRAKAERLIATCLELAAVDKIACERIAGVIRGLKTVARVDTTERREIDLNEHLRNTIKLRQAEFRQRVKVVTELAPLPPVECYPQMLSQVFLNILVNAAQAIEGEGAITVRTRVEGDSVCISIADTGKGIPPEEQSRVFAAGFTTKPVGVGTGLGLSIARKIVEENHGGSIMLESETGAGATFYIRIPIRARDRGAEQDSGNK